MFCFLNLTSSDKFRTKGVIAQCFQVGETVSCLNVLMYAMLHVGCNIFSPQSTCQSHWSTRQPPSNTEDPFLPGDTPQALQEALLVWERLLFLQTVCLCFFVSAGILEHTVSVWMETGARLQRIEALAGSPVGPARVNVAYV